PIFFSPAQHGPADVFRAVVAADGFRFSAPLNDLFERADHAFCRQREVDLDTETFAVVVVDDVEQPVLATIGKLIVHEVHRPGLVDGLWHGQRLRLVALEPLLRLDAQVQLQFAGRSGTRAYGSNRSLSRCAGTGSTGQSPSCGSLSSVEPASPRSRCSHPRVSVDSGSRSR